VTRGRHFGAQESVWSYFFEVSTRKNISKTDSRASKWLPRSQKQCCTLTITVFVTQSRHFGARESVWSYFFEASTRKNISKNDLRALKWFPRSQKQCGILTITVFVTQGRHFGARESLWSYFFEVSMRKNISKTDLRASKWLPRSQKQCWMKLYLTFGSKMDQYYNMVLGSS
jgi:hypothetical protein